MGCCVETDRHIWTFDRKSLVALVETKDVGHGEAQVSYGQNEKPKYPALRRAINSFYTDLLAPLFTFRKSVFLATGLDTALAARAKGRRKQEEEEPFKLTNRQAGKIDKAHDTMMDSLAGPDRSRQGFARRVPSDDRPDGVLQQNDRLTYAIGVQRAGRVSGQDTTISVSRDSPSVRAMLENAFDRLSQNGRLRLEGVLDEVKAVLVAAQDAGLNPLTTAELLSERFDQYENYEFQRLARTEAAYAAEQGTQEQLLELGMENVEILISAGACPICTEFEGVIVPLIDTDRLPPYHPNCLCSISPVEEETRPLGF